MITNPSSDFILLTSLSPVSPGIRSAGHGVNEVSLQQSSR